MSLMHDRAGLIGRSHSRVKSRPASKAPERGIHLHKVTYGFVCVYLVVCATNPFLELIENKLHHLLSHLNRALHFRDQRYHLDGFRKSKYFSLFSLLRKSCSLYKLALLEMEKVRKGAMAP